MIKFKTMVTAIAVIGGLTMALASNGMKKADPTAQKWFYYDPQQSGAEGNPENYTPTGNDGQDVPTCNQQTQNLCAIEAIPEQSNPDQPDLTQVSQSRYKPAE